MINIIVIFNSQTCTYVYEKMIVIFLPVSKFITSDYLRRDVSI